MALRGYILPFDICDKDTLDLIDEVAYLLQAEVSRIHGFVFAQTGFIGRALEIKMTRIDMSNRRRQTHERIVNHRLKNNLTFATSRLHKH